MSTLFIDEDDDARTSVLWTNEEPVVEATEGMRRLDADIERVTFRWLRRGDGPEEDMMTWDREALMMILIVAAGNTMLGLRQIEDQMCNEVNNGFVGYILEPEKYLQTNQLYLSYVVYTNTGLSA